MKRLQSTCAAISLAVLLAACSKGPNDDTVANDVKAKLYADASTKQASIDVAVKNGVVTLTGNAPNSDVALAAVNDANAVNGVKHVDDQIAVAGQLPNAGNPQQAAAPTPPAPAPAASNSAPANNPYDSGGSRRSSSSTPRSHESERASEREHARERHTITAVTIPAGTPIAIRTTETITSRSAAPGQTFPASLSEPIVVNGQEVIPRDAPVTLELASARNAGRIKGSAALALRVASLQYGGRSYPVESSELTEVGKGRGKQTAVRTGIGAAAGAIIGALAGGGKGAAIGSAAGAGAGLGLQVFTHGSPVTIPAETVMNFTLQAPVTLQ